MPAGQTRHCPMTSRHAEADVAFGFIMPENATLSAESDAPGASPDAEPQAPPVPLPQQHNTPVPQSVPPSLHYDVVITLCRVCRR